MFVEDVERRRKQQEAEVGWLGGVGNWQAMPHNGLLVGPLLLGDSNMRLQNLD